MCGNLEYPTKVIFVPLAGKEFISQIEFFAIAIADNVALLSPGMETPQHLIDCIIYTHSNELILILMLLL